jgi:hypothetical protein
LVSEHWPLLVLLVLLLGVVVCSNAQAELFDRALR